MKKLLLGAAAASLLFATPAFADRIVIKDGHRNHYHHRYHAPYRAYNQMHCRTVVIRDHRPSGRVVVRHVRKCR